MWFCFIGYLQNLLFVLFQASALELQERVVTAIKQVDEKLNFDDITKLEDIERNHLLNLYRETMLKGYNFGFEVLIMRCFHIFYYYTSLSTEIIHLNGLM